MSQIAMCAIRVVAVRDDCIASWRVDDYVHHQSYDMFGDLPKPTHTAYCATLYASAPEARLALERLKSEPLLRGVTLELVAFMAIPTRMQAADFCIECGSADHRQDDCERGDALAVLQSSGEHDEAARLRRVLQRGVEMAKRERVADLVAERVKYHASQAVQSFADGPHRTGDAQADLAEAIDSIRSMPCEAICARVLAEVEAL